LEAEEMDAGGSREGILTRPKAFIAWLWKRSAEESSVKS